MVRDLRMLVFGAAVASAMLVFTPFASSRPAAKVVTVRASDSGFRLSAKAAPVGTVTSP